MKAEFLGIDIGGTNTRLGLVDSDGRVISRGKLKTSMEAGPGVLVEDIFKKIAQKLQSDIFKRKGGTIK